MDIEELKNGEVKVTCHTQIEKTFWEVLKAERKQDKAQIESLKKENRILSQELSYLKLKSKTNITEEYLELKEEIENGANVQTKRVEKL